MQSAVPRESSSAAFDMASGGVIGGEGAEPMISNFPRLFAATLCGLHGHDHLLQFQQGRMFLRFFVRPCIAGLGSERSAPDRHGRYRRSASDVRALADRPSSVAFTWSRRPDGGCIDCGPARRRPFACLDARGPVRAPVLRGDRLIEQIDRAGPRPRDLDARRRPIDRHRRRLTRRQQARPAAHRHRHLPSQYVEVNLIVPAVCSLRDGAGSTLAPGASSNCPMTRSAPLASRCTTCTGIGSLLSPLAVAGLPVLKPCPVVSN